MPRIGMRMFKTAVAVFLCFFVYLFRSNGTPFYSAIAAVLCIQQDLKNSRKQAKSRMISTLIGGLLGMCVLWVLQQWKWMQIELVHYFIVSMMIIPALYIPVLIKQPQSAYISCVVFMSITISHIHDENPFVFASNRMIDTLIGIVIALLVNMFPLPKKIDNSKVCCIKIDYEEDLKSLMNTYTSYRMKQLLYQGANIVFTSVLHPAKVYPVIRNFQVKCYVYDGIMVLNKDGSLQCETLLELFIWQSIYRKCKNMGLFPFVYEIRDGILYTHYERFYCDWMKNIYKSTKGTNMYRYQYHKDIVAEMCTDVVCLEYYVNDCDKSLFIQILNQFPIVQYTQVSYNHTHICFRIYAQQKVEEKDNLNKEVFVYHSSDIIKQLQKTLYL